MTRWLTRDGPAKGCRLKRSGNLPHVEPPVALIRGGNNGMSGWRMPAVVRPAALRTWEHSKAHRRPVHMTWSATCGNGPTATSNLTQADNFKEHRVAS